jgi:2-haloacid dehalogenase
MTIRAVLFDAYGTLLDVTSIGETAERLFPGQGVTLVRLWRDKQLQYSWLRTLSRNYADFWQVTADALDYAAAALGLSPDPAEQGELMVAWERLAPFPDASPALATLVSRGMPLAVLSNGTPAMLAAAIGHAGLGDRFAALLSVDAVAQYKTAPAAYQLAVEHFGAAPGELLLVSSNGWDAAGATAFGLQTFWVNRSGAPVERVGVTPTASGTSLLDLPVWLEARNGAAGG